MYLILLLLHFNFNLPFVPEKELSHKFFNGEVEHPGLQMPFEGPEPDKPTQTKKSLSRINRNINLIPRSSITQPQSQRNAGTEVTARPCSWLFTLLN